MPDTIIAKSQFVARGMLLGERLDLRTLEQENRLAAAPLAVYLPGGGIAVLFRYGAAVFFDVTPESQQAFLQRLQPHVSQAYVQPETEQVFLRIDAAAREGIEADAIVLADAAVQKLQIVADVLSKSMMLAMYEQRLAAMFDRIEPFAANLQIRGVSGRAMRELLQHLGSTLLTEHRMVGRAELGDKPELIWEHPHLERLFVRLAEEFEIRDRDDALNRKLELITRTTQIAIELLNHRRSLRVEWYIVGLIVFEIVLSLWDRLWPWLSK